MKSPDSLLVASAVVFAYHDIGVRCLAALVELGIDIRLVITHQDDHSEEIWFDSVEGTARRNGIPVITPRSPNVPDVIDRVERCQPDYIFSFYYRKMLTMDMLDIPKRGAFNVHGSLLPKYRGRVPVNWAIIQGEHECGVSLHRMISKPDAGNLIAQQAVAILANDTAHDVYQKLKCAAESMLMQVVPEMIAGTFNEKPQNLDQGSYFSGRKPRDGAIDWSKPAWNIHNLIRAVAPPYPGAFFYHGKHRIEILGSHYRKTRARFSSRCIYFENGSFWADCDDGHRFMITKLTIDRMDTDLRLFSQIFPDRLNLDPDSGQGKSKLAE